MPKESKFIKLAEILVDSEGKPIIRYKTVQCTNRIKQDGGN